MSVHPILAALRRHKAGVVLISLQIALTLMIICNALFIIGQRIERIRRSTGLNESNLFLITQSYVGAPNADSKAGIDQLDAMERADLSVLNSLPEVESAAYSFSLPLLGSTWDSGLSLKPNSKGSVTSSFYFGDEHLQHAMGLELVAGRNFVSTDIQHASIGNVPTTPVILITNDVARQLFPGTSAIGKQIYQDDDGSPMTVIGIVKSLQTPSTDSQDAGNAYNSILVPIRIDASFSRYAIRAKPGQMEQAMKSAKAALFKLNPMRVIPGDIGIRSFVDIRAQAYRADISMAVLMGTLCLILLSLTAAGIVGLTSFWVGKRTRQIGMRRALGARAIDIAYYFHVENLLITGAGVVAGLFSAIALNRWLMLRYEMSRLPASYVLIGVLVVLALGQLSVWPPARRASRVTPMAAIRSS